MALTRRTTASKSTHNTINGFPVLCLFCGVDIIDVGRQVNSLACRRTFNPDDARLLDLFPPFEMAADPANP
jgi:hypothetical protein